MSVPQNIVVDLNNVMFCKGMYSLCVFYSLHPKMIVLISNFGKIKVRASLSG